jgi:hypothetical protein
MTLGILFSTNRGMLDMRTTLKKCGVKHWATLGKCYVMSNIVMKIVVALGKAKKTWGGGVLCNIGKSLRDIDQMLRRC